jgi:hypothetical protein
MRSDTETVLEWGTEAGEEAPMLGNALFSLRLGQKAVDA